MGPSWTSTFHRVGSNRITYIPVPYSHPTLSGQSTNPTVKKQSVELMNPTAATRNTTNDAMRQPTRPWSTPTILVTTLWPCHRRCSDTTSCNLRQDSSKLRETFIIQACRLLGLLHRHRHYRTTRVSPWFQPQIITVLGPVTPLWAPHMASICSHCQVTNISSREEHPFLGIQRTPRGQITRSVT
jgi:hypothetical protein